MFGNFNENGPYGVDTDQKRTSSSCVRFIIFSFTQNFKWSIIFGLRFHIVLVFPRKFSWNTKYSMLYIDNPVNIINYQCKFYISSMKDCAFMRWI